MRCEPANSTTAMTSSTPQHPEVACGLDISVSVFLQCPKPLVRSTRIVPRDPSSGAAAQVSARLPGHLRSAGASDGDRPQAILKCAIPELA